MIGWKKKRWTSTFYRPGFKLWIWTGFCFVDLWLLLSTYDAQFSQKIEISSFILTVAEKIQLNNISAGEWGPKGRDCMGEWWREENGCCFSENLFPNPMPPLLSWKRVALSLPCQSQDKDIIYYKKKLRKLYKSKNLSKRAIEK